MDSFMPFVWFLMGAGLSNIIAALFLIRDDDSKIALKTAGIPLLLSGFILAVILLWSLFPLIQNNGKYSEYGLWDLLQGYVLRVWYILGINLWSCYDINLFAKFWNNGGYWISSWMCFFYLGCCNCIGDSQITTAILRDVCLSMTEKFLSTNQVAQKLGINVRTVLRLIREDDFPAILVGKSYRISESELIRWMDQHKIRRQPWKFW